MIFSLIPTAQRRPSYTTSKRSETALYKYVRRPILEKSKAFIEEQRRLNSSYLTVIILSYDEVNSRKKGGR